MNKQQLAAKIWESANKMRSKIEANEYKDYILGFIFYKFLSDKEVRYLKEIGYTDDDIDTVVESESEIVENIQKNLGYFIDYNNLFSTWLSMGNDFDAANVRDALSAFGRLVDSSHKKVFDGVFDTLQTGLSKLGDSNRSQTKSISDLIHLIKDIPMDGKQDYDVLGFIYEYLISNFAANAGKKAGEFYTPHEVSVLMSEIVANHLKDRKEIRIYDPTSGSGSLLINIGRCVAKYMGSDDKIKYYAQELKENTYNLTRMNLIMRGILPSNIVTRNGDTLEEDWPYFEENDPVGTYEPLYVDAVVSNPPYSQNWDPSDKESDPRYARFGLAPKSKADYAFLLHDLFHIKSDGIMTIVLPHGVLFRGNEEGQIRKNLIENNHIDAIIGLPANIFFGTGIPTIIMVLRQKRENTDVLIVDASKNYEKVGKNNKLRASDIKRITDAVIGRKDVPKFSRVVTREEIRENDYNLNIPRYVDSSEKSESWDIYSLMFGGIPNSELNDYSEYWDAFPGLRDDLFAPENEAYVRVKVDDLKKAVMDHKSVQTYRNKFLNAFEGFDSFLRDELIGSVESINISREEDVLSKDIFSRMEGIPLVDGYSAYQILDDKYQKIAVDLEIIQTEGIGATRIVDPNMVVKKKNGAEVEVQEGFIGRIIPFELVQGKILQDDLESINNDENRLAEIESSYDEALEELPEDVKEKSFINEDGSAFVWTEVKKSIREKSEEKDILDILKIVHALNEEEKKLKKQIKQKSSDLHLKTKEVIENLSDEDVVGLLYSKWIRPIVSGIMGLPDNAVSDLCNRLQNLGLKYNDTMDILESEIKKTELVLSKMMGELVGNEYDMKGLEEFKLMLGRE